MPSNPDRAGLVQLLDERIAARGYVGLTNSEAKQVRAALSVGTDAGTPTHTHPFCPECGARIGAPEYCDCATMTDVAREVLCRVFDDGPDAATPEFHEWYKPTDWLWWGRGLGAFIRQRLDRMKSAVSGPSAWREVEGFYPHGFAAQLRGLLDPIKSGTQPFVMLDRVTAESIADCLEAVARVSTGTEEGHADAPRASSSEKGQ